MSSLKKHIFICEHQRPEGKKSCGRLNGAGLKKALKRKLAARGLHKTFRANSAGCLDACEHGPAMVIYPRGIWYGAVEPGDLDSIIENSLIADRIIERLCIREKRCPLTTEIHPPGSDSDKL